MGEQRTLAGDRVDRGGVVRQRMAVDRPAVATGDQGHERDKDKSAQEQDAAACALSDSPEPSRPESSDDALRLDLRAHVDRHEDRS